MEKKLFENSSFSTLHKKIVCQFKDCDKLENSRNYNGLSVNDIEKIRGILYELDNKYCFKNNEVVQLCFYDLVYKSICALKKNKLNYIYDEKLKDAQIQLTEKWKTKLENKIKNLQYKIKSNYKKIFGEKLKKVMIERQITVESLAKLLGVSEATIYNYFKGTYMPDDFYILLQISNLLECTVQYLIDPDTVMPEVTFQAIYEDIGLSQSSVLKLREIRPYAESKAITRALNILIENIEIDHISDYDVLSSIATYLRVHPYNEPKHLISDNLLNQYKEEFKNINDVEEAKSKFQRFIKELKSESIETMPIEAISHTIDRDIKETSNTGRKPAKTSKKFKWGDPIQDNILFTDVLKVDPKLNSTNRQSFERQNILYLLDIQEKLVRLQSEIKDIDEPEKYLSIADYKKYESEIEKMEDEIKEQEKRNQQNSDNE